MMMQEVGFGADLDLDIPKWVVSLGVFSQISKLACLLLVQVYKLKYSVYSGIVGFSNIRAFFE